MRNLLRADILAWLLAAFFIFGGFGNIFASEAIRADYGRWGYPEWFPYLTGGLELTAAALIAYRPMRLWGAGLASLVMIAAVGTVLSHGEFAHAIAPLVVLAAALMVGFQVWRARPAA